MMLGHLDFLATSPDHVAAATGMDALPYIGAVVLWLLGVTVLILRKLRAA
jgi:hypothetical protein